MKTYKLYTLLALLGAMSFCTSCEDDEVVKTPLGTTSISSANATVSSLTFSWEAVSGATQYAYELRDPDEALVKGDVTTGLTATFTGLKDNTTYTLTVWSYAALSSDKTTSPVAKLTATTAKIVPLEVPAPSAEMQNGQMVLSWDAVENASYYSYQLYSLEDDVETEITDSYTYDASVTFEGLALGTYRFYIQAMSENEAYSNSEIVKIDFERTKLELKRVTGTYTGMNGATGSADLVSYDDGSYTIEAFHGVEGYNLDFAVDPSNAQVKILNVTAVDGYEYVWMDASYSMSPYCFGDYSHFEGDMRRGEVWFYAYYYDKEGNYITGDYYDFVWGAPAVDTWSAEGRFLMAKYPDEPWNATIYANGNGSYTIKAWYYVEGVDMNFTVDNEGNVSFITNVGYEDEYYWWVPGNDDYWLYITKPGYDLDPVFEGDVNGGSLKFYDAYDGWVSFTWGQGTAIGGSVTIDDLVGTYNETFTGDVYWSGAQEDASYDNGEAVITKVDDTTITLKGLFGCEEELVGTVDIDAKTITFAAGQTFLTYYTLGASSGISDALVATFDDDCTITIDGIGLWYASYNYNYLDGAKSVLTKK